MSDGPLRVDAAAKRQSAIPNPQSLILCSRGGFTLIELLVTIGIMLMLVTAAVTILPSATESRRIREAARGVNIYLSSARNRAMESGRSCGVTFHVFSPGTSPGFAMNADQCEVPPPYAGDNTNSTATVTGGTATLDAAPPTGMVNAGDLIQFNYQGPLYSIGTVNGGTLTISFADPNGNTTNPWAATVSSPMPYRILRAPMKGGATPLQLPATTVIDLEYSGCVTNGSAGQQDLTVLFSPTGAVDRVYYGAGYSAVTDPVYILIGRRDRAANQMTALPTAPAVKTDAELTNVEDLNNLLVAVSPNAGQINTEPVAARSDDAVPLTACEAYWAAYNAAKAAGATDGNAAAAGKKAAMGVAGTLAKQGIGMGGR